MKKIFFLAGEASGDALGGRLIEELKSRYPQAELKGVGGSYMAQAGLDVVLPSDKLAVMGIWEIIGNFMRLKKIHNDLLLQIEDFAPDAIVTIDFPDFNFLLGKALKKRGKVQAKHIHYVAPSVWAWRPKRAEYVSRFLDGIMCLFPFEPDYFRKHNLPSAFVGHSLVEEAPEKPDGAAFRENVSIPQDVKTMGILFGSRMRELSANGDTFKDVVRMVQETHPDIHIIVPTVPHLEYEVLKIVEDLDLPVYVVAKPEQKWSAFAACDVALAVSGTVGLELTYAGVPHVIAYKTSPVTWAMIKLLVKVKYAHLVNILLDGDFIPEFLQSKCKPLDIGEAVLDLLEKPETAIKQKDASMKIRHLIGAYDEKSPSSKAVDFIEQVVAESVTAPVLKEATVKQKAPEAVPASSDVKPPKVQSQSKAPVHKVQEKEGESPAVLILKKIWVFLRNL